ncbi:MAG TPA: ATP-binding protein [Chloroflexia bacterium]|nr:ATP-binding protein [Chloroflexia bacterium]
MPTRLVDDAAARLAALQRYAILDTPPEAPYDDLAQLAATLCGVPMATVTLLAPDRQWHKARVGLDETAAPAGDALGLWTIRQADGLLVPDARADARFAADPRVTGAPGIRFYAGVPLQAPEGPAIGLIAVLDRVPRELAAAARTGLTLLSRQVMAQLDARRQVAAAREAVALANRTKSSFLANMSHELRTPLNAILGYSELLRETAEEQGLAEFVAELARIETSGRHLLRLINQILDITRLESGTMTLELQTFPLAPLIADVVTTIGALVARNDNVLQVEGPADAGTMHTDRLKVRQILLNLLGDAARFTQHGTIRLRVWREGSDAAALVGFQVADSGQGIEPAQLARLFQPFTPGDEAPTRKYGGLGLGLALSKQFCDLMGGTIAAESALGAGSTFTVCLPAVVADRVPPVPK